MLIELILYYKLVCQKNFVRMPFGELAIRMNWCRREKTFNLHDPDGHQRENKKTKKIAKCSKLVRNRNQIKALRTKIEFTRIRQRNQFLAFWVSPGHGCDGTKVRLKRRNCLKLFWVAE